MVSISINSTPSNGYSAPKNSATSSSSSLEIQLSLAEGLLAPQSVVLSGFDLTLGSVVAGARLRKDVTIDESPALLSRIDESVAFLKSKVRLCRSIPDCWTIFERDDGYPNLLLTSFLAV